MAIMMTAQELYDLRETTEIISGSDLHEILEALTGDPSPAGSTAILMADFWALGETDGRIELLAEARFRVRQSAPSNETIEEAVARYRGRA